MNVSVQTNTNETIVAGVEVVTETGTHVLTNGKLRSTRSLTAATADGTGVKRIVALDFTKGALVLTMVLYHWLNYFVGTQRFFYRYLAFLPPSFIFITGFLISRVYLSKYRTRDVRLSRRLIIRGLKILSVFLVLNALPLGLNLVRASHIKASGEALSISRAALLPILFSGNLSGERIVSFYILLPISYLLLLSSLLAIVKPYVFQVFHMATVGVLAAIMVLNATGNTSTTLELIWVGLLGISLGYIPMERINKGLERPYLVLLAYGFYVAAITVWNANYPLQVTGVVLTLMVIYGVGSASHGNSLISESMALLGRYSLFGYLVQIAILRVLHRIWSGGTAGRYLTLSLFIALVLTLMAVKSVDLARNGCSLADRMYRAVFS